MHALRVHVVAVPASPSPRRKGHASASVSLTTTNTDVPTTTARPHAHVLSRVNPHLKSPDPIHRPMVPAADAHAALAMAARHLLAAHHDSRSPRPAPPPAAPAAEERGTSFPMLLPVFLLFVLLLCFLSIFLLHDLLRFFSLWLRRRQPRRFHDAAGDVATDDDDDDGARAQAPRKPPGLDPSVLASFPTVRFEAEEAAGSAAPAECAVCLSEFAAGDAVRLLTVCRHAFHAPCIDSWLGAHTTCPVCRSDLDPPAKPAEALVVHETTDHRTTSRPASDHR